MARRSVITRFPPWPSTRPPRGMWLLVLASLHFYGSIGTLRLATNQDASARQQKGTPLRR